LIFSSTAWHVRLKQYYTDTEKSADLKQHSLVISAQHHYKEKRNLEKACETDKKDVKDENQRCDKTKRDERKEKEKDRKRLEDRKDEDKHKKELKEGDPNKGENKSKKRELEDFDGEGKEKKRVRILEGKSSSKELEIEHKKHEESSCKRKEKDDNGKKKEKIEEYEEDKKEVDGEKVEAKKTYASETELKERQNSGKKKEVKRVKLEGGTKEHKVKARERVDKQRDNKKVKIENIEAERKEKIKEHSDISDKHKKEHKHDREKRYEKTPRKDNSSGLDIKKIASSSKGKDDNISDDSRSCFTPLRPDSSQIEGLSILSPTAFSAPVEDSGNPDGCGGSVCGADKKESAVCDLSHRLSASSPTQKEVCLEASKQSSVTPVKMECDKSKSCMVMVKKEPVLKTSISKCHSLSGAQTPVTLVDQIIASMDTSTPK
jgi:hypothetical protein